MKRLTTSLICPVCGHTYEKANSEIKRNANKGRLNFCSISCAVSYRNKLHPTKGNPSNLKKGSEKDELSPFRYTFRKMKMHCKQSHGKKTFDVTLEDLKDVWNKQHGKCVYSNVDLKLPTDEFTKIPLTKRASLDRIDSSKGYTKDNIQFVSSCINLMKNTMSDLETKRFLKEISSFTSTFEEEQTISSSQNEMADAQAGN